MIGGLPDIAGIEHNLLRIVALERAQHISEKPMMALSGVRSSWLILAMNSDLALEASSASTLAAWSASEVLWRMTALPKLSENSDMSERHP